MHSFVIGAQLHVVGKPSLTTAPSIVLPSARLAFNLNSWTPQPARLNRPQKTRQRSHLLGSHLIRRASPRCGSPLCTSVSKPLLSNREIRDVIAAALATVAVRAMAGCAVTLEHRAPRTRILRRRGQTGRTYNNGKEREGAHDLHLSYAGYGLPLLPGSLSARVRRAPSPTAAAFSTAFDQLRLRSRPTSRTHSSRREGISSRAPSTP